MANVIEAAHQAIKAGSGVLAVASAAMIQPARLVAILKGQTQMSGPEAAGIAAQTGQSLQALLRIDPDVQASVNRNSVP